VNVIFVASGAIVIAVFLMASGDLFYEKLIRIMPSFSDKKAALRIVLDVEREVSAYLLSITLINAGLATAVGVAFWAIGLPTPHLWALFAFILNYIPYLGPITGLVLSAAIGLVVFDNIGQAALAPLPRAVQPHRGAGAHRGVPRATRRGGAERQRQWQRQPPGRPLPLRHSLRARTPACTPARPWRSAA